MENYITDFTGMAEIIERLGIEWPAESAVTTLEQLEFNSIRLYDFLPDFALLIRSTGAKQAFVFQRGAITTMPHGILLVFNNFFDDEPTGVAEVIPTEKLPSVQIVPLSSEIKIQVAKHSHQKVISIIVSLEFIQHLLKSSQSSFGFLFKKKNDFFIEHLLSADIMRVAHEISESTTQLALPEFYFRMKTIELLYYLFRELNERKDVCHHPITSSELRKLYKVRDALTTKLDAPITIKELIATVGMNELKLRKLFTQVFGMGMYDYFQHIRMQEAARLLRYNKMSVAEVGEQLGFTNLSHFSRLFEAYAGMKPKKWSMTGRTD